MNKNKNKFMLFLLLSVMIMLSMACSLTEVLTSATSTPEATITPTLTPMPKSPQSEHPPKNPPAKNPSPNDQNRPENPPPPRTPQPHPTNEPPQNNTGSAKIYMVALNDAGQSGPMIGCNDSIVAVEVTIPQNQPALRATLEKLLSIHTREYGGSGLYNALYQSNLQIQAIENNNGAVKINLTGNLTSSGSCENPRIKAQLEETVKRFPNVNTVKYFVNGRNLDDLLSGG
jgi:hypothetical protein